MYLTTIPFKAACNVHQLLIQLSLVGHFALEKGLSLHFAEPEIMHDLGDLRRGTPLAGIQDTDVCLHRPHFEGNERLEIK